MEMPVSFVVGVDLIGSRCPGLGSRKLVGIVRGEGIPEHQDEGLGTILTNAVAR